MGIDFFSNGRLNKKGNCSEGKFVSQKRITDTKKSFQKTQK